MRAVRSVLVLAVGLALAGFVAARSGALDAPLGKDFLEYWAAGRASARGENPYDPARLLAEQRTADPARTEAVMMWNPPPALALYAPLGALPPGPASLLWALVQMGSVFGACALLWRAYAPGFALWPALALAAGGAGTWWLVVYGQNTGLIVLGLAGFLHFRRDRPFAAGACAALTALKPHLLAAFGVLLIADALTRRGARALAGGCVALALALAAVLLTNPAVVSQFVEAARNPAPGATPLSEWWLPAPAFWLRRALDPDAFWIQFVPCALACAWLLARRAVRGAQWDWARELPLVVAVSYLAAPYGCWPFDLPVLFVPVVWAVARLARAGRARAAVLVGAGQLAVAAASFARPGALHEFWWLAPAVLLLCVPALARE